MIAVVTGSSGFIGTHLVEALRARGAEVRPLRRNEVDLLDPGSVARAPIWDGATHCFHLAGLTRGRTAIAFQRANLLPTEHIAGAFAARGSSALRLIHFSSQAAAGPSHPGGPPLREDATARPVEAYGESKLAGERALANYGDAFPWTVIRPSCVYGPRDIDFLAVFRQACRRYALYASPMDQPVSIVHVRDLIAAALRAADVDAAVGRTYFVANQHAVTWRELYESVARFTGSAPRHLQVPAPLLRIAARIADLLPAFGRAPLLTAHKATLALQPAWLCAADRARSELGWAESVPLEAGLRETFDWYRAAGWLRVTPKPVAVTA